MIRALTAILLFVADADDEECEKASDEYTDSVKELENAQKKYTRCVVSHQGYYSLCSEELQELNAADNGINAMESFYFSKCE
jgi:hypothetical protein